MSAPPGFAQLPRNGYEAVVSRQPKWDAEKKEAVTSWSVAEIRFYGRSIYNDLVLILGVYSTYASGANSYNIHAIKTWSWPDGMPSKEAALMEADRLIEKHRNHCYALTERP